MDEQTVETTVEKATETKPETGLADLQAELERIKTENEKLRKANTAASADASEWKKKFRATQDEASRAEAERNETLEALEAENKQLKRTQTIAEHKAGFLSLGMNSETADRAAGATVENNFSELMETFKAFLSDHDKALRAEMVKNTPAPVSGQTAPGVTRESFDSMNLRERMQLFNENPEAYKLFNSK